MSETRQDKIRQNLEFSFENKGTQSFLDIITFIKKIAKANKHPIEGEIERFCIDGRPGYDNDAVLERISVTISTVKENRLVLLDDKTVDIEKRGA